MDTLLASGWKDIHVVSAGTEIFIAREGGRSNPMRQAAAAPATAVAPTPLEAEVVTAPHVASVVSVLAVGTIVSAGDRVATIRVLDEEEIISAPSAGSVAAIHVDAGALIEFKAPIVSLTGVAP
jgi:biotin carboxyl carrier protein